MRNPSFTWVFLVFLGLGFLTPGSDALAKGRPGCELRLSHRRQILDRNVIVRDKRIRVAFFDADDTLRVSKSGRVSANGPEDVELLPGVAERIRALNVQGYLVAIVSNQNGIPKQVSFRNADEALMRTVELLASRGAVVNYYDFAEYADHNRKPEVGMARTLQAIIHADFGPSVQIDWKNSFMVGDAAFTMGELRPDGTVGTNFSNSDRLFAENLGIPFYEAQEYFRGLSRPAKKAGDAPRQFNGRLFTPITEAELDEKIKEAWAAHPSFRSEAFMEFDSLTPEIQRDLSKVEFSTENMESRGYHTLPNGLTYLEVKVGGDWEKGFVFVIYWDGKILRAYIPTEGNPWNTDTKAAYGNNDEADIVNLRKRYPDLFSEAADEDVLASIRLVRIDPELIQADIQKRIKPRTQRSSN